MSIKKRRVGDIEIAHRWDGQAHLEALRELAAAPEHQRLECISREKDPAEAT
jgi:hypothetical protein